jgi:outer membrane protein assembly factor BamB
MNISLNRLLLVLFVISNVYTTHSQNTIQNSWNQFRGPERDGVSKEVLANPGTPELIWEKELGSGFSELVLTEDVLYTMISEKTDSLSGIAYVAAFDRNNGNEIWRTKVDSMYVDADGWGDGPRSTPIIDKDKIYSLTGHGKLSANSRKDGKLIWQIDFINDFGSKTPRWGYASSPIIVDDKLIMEVGGTESRTFMAFNKDDGSVIWNSGSGNASHDSPLKVTIDGQEQIIFANVSTLYSYNSKGDTIWTYNMPFRYITAMPLLFDKNKIFASGVRNPGFFIIEIENNKPTELLTGSSMKNDYNSCVYHDGYFYGYHVAALRCISAETGEVSWTKRGFGKGSLIMVDDKLLVLSDKGRLAIVKATPDAYIELQSIQAIEGKSWTAPSFLDGKVYVRNLSEMAYYKLN